MPIVQISLIEGRTVDQKRKVAAGITDLIVKELDAPPDAVRVIFQEMRKENYAAAGVLFADRK